MNQTSFKKVLPSLYHLVRFPLNKNLRIECVEVIEEQRRTNFLSSVNY